MDLVFEEIKNIVVFQSKDFTQTRTCDLLSFGGDIDTVTSEDYHVLGVSNEIGKELLHEPKDKYMGKIYTRNYLLRASNYQEYQYINIESYLYDDIVGFEIINDEMYYELKTCDTIDRMKSTREYHKFPRKTRSYFINKKTKVCSCDDFVIYGDCKHARNMNLTNLKMVFTSKLGKEIADDLCGICE